ncbi:hypothetical protein PUN28_020592 [Cardiocondyla obscurior]|uniref:Uncharacterized protein n=1 Tax=Cardiocondyla obscurior TaxID=286306 RepID=A0AAW2E8L2_9HYME
MARSNTWRYSITFSQKDAYKLQSNGSNKTTSRLTYKGAIKTTAEDLCPSNMQPTKNRSNTPSEPLDDTKTEMPSRMSARETINHVLQQCHRTHENT